MAVGSPTTFRKDDRLFAYMYLPHMVHRRSGPPPPISGPTESDVKDTLVLDAEKGGLDYRPAALTTTLGRTIRG